MSVRVDRLYPYTDFDYSIGVQMLMRMQDEKILKRKATHDRRDERFPPDVKNSLRLKI